jgi:hypothetical protein
MGLQAVMCNKIMRPEGMGLISLLRLAFEF